MRPLQSTPRPFKRCMIRRFISTLWTELPKPFPSNRGALCCIQTDSCSETSCVLQLQPCDKPVHSVVLRPEACALQAASLSTLYHPPPLCCYGHNRTPLTPPASLPNEPSITVQMKKGMVRLRAHQGQWRVLCFCRTFNSCLQSCKPWQPAVSRFIPRPPSTGRGQGAWRERTAWPETLRAPLGPTAPCHRPSVL